MKKLSVKLKEYRENIGMSITDVAFHLGVSDATVRKIESKNSYTNNTVQKLCDAYGKYDFERYFLKAKCRQCGDEFIPRIGRNIVCDECASTNPKNSYRYLRVAPIVRSVNIARPLLSASDVEALARKEKLSYGYQVAKGRL